MQIIGATKLINTPLAYPASGGATRVSSPVSAVATKPPPSHRQNHLLHTIAPEKIEVFKSLESWASKDLLPLLKPVEKSWQPVEFLPDPTKPIDEFMDEVRALRVRTKELPDEYFVVLVGDMVTEEILPPYQSMMMNLDGVRDETGSNPTPWATWIQAWAAEENRHSDLLKTYLYLSGRVDMLMIERTVHHLIRNGLNPGLDKNPYLAFVYTSFQERATFISHCNTAQLASKGGDPVLAKICGAIAADEKRHENAYIKVMEKLLDVDPNEAMIAIGKMIRKKITMPGHLMMDGQDPHLFQHFAFLAHKIGVYKLDDYANILEFLIGRWGLDKLEGLNDEAMREQDYVCSLGPKIKKLNVHADQRAKNYKGLNFSWIFNRELKF